MWGSIFLWQYILPIQEQLLYFIFQIIFNKLQLLLLTGYFIRFLDFKSPNFFNVCYSLFLFSKSYNSSLFLVPNAEIGAIAVLVDYYRRVLFAFRDWLYSKYYVSCIERWARNVPDKIAELIWRKLSLPSPLPPQVV